MLLEVITQYHSIVGGAIAGGAVLASGLASWLSGKHQAKEADKRQQKYIMEQMAQQNQYNIDAFNRENAYNHPSAQAQRAYEAGLNPNWVDGLGAIGQQESSVSGSFNSHVADSLNLDVAGAINAYNQFRQTKSQIDVNKSVEARNKAEEKLLQTQEVTERSRPANLESSTSLNNANAGLANQQTVDLQKTLASRIHQLESSANLSDEERNELILSRSLRLQNMRAQMQYLKDSIRIEEGKLEEQKRSNKVGEVLTARAQDKQLEGVKYSANMSYKAQHEANVVQSSLVSGLNELHHSESNKTTLEGYEKVLQNRVFKDLVDAEVPQKEARRKATQVGLAVMRDYQEWKKNRPAAKWADYENERLENYNDADWFFNNIWNEAKDVVPFRSLK